MGTAETCDVLVVGGGPIGLEVHAALKDAGVGVAHVEAGYLGWTMGWWAAGTTFFSSPERIEIAGVPLVTRDQGKATREAYLAYLRQVAGARGLNVQCGWLVESIEREGDGFVVGMRRSVRGVGGREDGGEVGEDGAPHPGPLPRGEREEERGARRPGPLPGGEREERRVWARRVVLAIGNMHRARMLGVPGEEREHVSHYLADPHGYYGRDVLIVGGKNSAVEAAIRLYRVGARVTVSYRGERFDPERVKYWLRPELEWLIEKGKIGFLPGSEVVSIGERSVRVRAGGAEREIAADRVLLLTGYEQDATLFERAGVELVGEERRPKFDRATMETNVPGLYVAGTATGGTQRRTRVFIETSHVHASRIVASVTGRASVAGDVSYGAYEES